MLFSDYEAPTGKRKQLWDPQALVTRKESWGYCSRWRSRYIMTRVARQWQCWELSPYTRGRLCIAAQTHRLEFYPPGQPPPTMKFFSTLFGASMLAAAASGSPTSFGELMTPTAPLKRAAQAITQVTNFGANTSGTKMYIYVPSKLAASPPIIVAIHYCTGTAQAYYNGSPYASLADQKGFIVIYPESPYSGTCWDVSSKAALTHNGGGDSNSIANMVTYALKQYSGDASKVFVTGSSSGAMMTVCLLRKRDFTVDCDDKGVDFMALRSCWPDGLERNGCNVPGIIRRRNSLFWDPSWMLLQPVWRCRCLEQLLCKWSNP